jgi:hypothetical protein
MENRIAPAEHTRVGVNSNEPDGLDLSGCRA